MHLTSKYSETFQVHHKWGLKKKKKGVGGGGGGGGVVALRQQPSSCHEQIQDQSDNNHENI